MDVNEGHFSFPDVFSHEGSSIRIASSLSVYALLFILPQGWWSDLSGKNAMDMSLSTALSWGTPVLVQDSVML